MSLIFLLVLCLSGCQVNTHEITFDTDFAVTIESVMVEHGEILELPIIQREGHQFLGWFVSKSSESPIYNTADPVINSFTLYAKWRINSYQVNFDSQGGTEVLGYTALYQSSIEPPENPIKNGFVFVGWSLEQASDEIYEFDTMPGHDLLLYAIWEENTNTGASPADAIEVSLNTLYEVYIGINESVIFRFEPPYNGQFSIQSYGNFDTYLKVYQLLDSHGTPISWDDLYQIEFADDFGDGQNFMLAIDMNQDVIYYLQVEMFFSSVDEGIIEFQIYDE